MAAFPTIIVGSSSPRRRDLIQLIVPPDSIRVLPPREDEERGFEGVEDWDGIEQILSENARTKYAAVVAQLAAGDPAGSVVVAADTIIVGQDASGRLACLGKPPPSDWQATVSRWFRDYFAGRPHFAVTGMVVGRPDQTRERTLLVRTTVRFTADVERWLPWYLSTGESVGKAGGYALQGAAGLFVDSVQGSLSNVIGLPLRELSETLVEFGVPVIDAPTSD